MISSFAKTVLNNRKTIASAPKCLLPDEPIRLMSGRQNYKADETIHLMSDRPDSKPDESHLSGSEAFMSSACVQRSKQQQRYRTSMWGYSDHHRIEPSTSVLPRFDIQHYRISDKAERKYQRTWTDFPKVRVLPKNLGKYEKEAQSPHQRQDVVDGEEEDANPTSRKKRKKTKYPKVTLPGCRPGPCETPLCKVEHKHTIYKKVYAPYPAFSECRKRDPNKQRAVKCLGLSPSCEIWDTIRAKIWM